MYWPIGAPRIYASSNNKLTKGRVIRVDDGADSHQDSFHSANAPGSSSDAVQDTEESASGFLTPLTSSIKHVENDGQRRLSTKGLGSVKDELEEFVAQKEDENIISLKISRSGHLFAVITSTTLTIWQTKVMKHVLWRDLRSHLIANRCIGCSSTFYFISRYIWFQCLFTRSSRFGHLRCANN